MKDKNNLEPDAYETGVSASLNIGEVNLKPTLTIDLRQIKEYKFIFDDKEEIVLESEKVKRIIKELSKDGSKKSIRKN